MFDGCLSGTLTKNEMTVICLSTSEGYYADVTGAGYNDHGEIMIHKCDNMDQAKMSVFGLLEVRQPQLELLKILTCYLLNLSTHIVFTQHKVSITV